MSDIGNLYPGVMDSRECRYVAIFASKLLTDIGNRRLSTHEGLIMYIHDDFAYKDLNQEITISSTSTLFESHYVEIWRKSCTFQKYVIGNVYRLPSYNAEDLSAFTNEYSDLLNRLRLGPNSFTYVVITT